MKQKLNNIALPSINPDRRTHHNFYSVCIKAIENNKEGVLDKKECIEKIKKLRTQTLYQIRKKNYNRLSSLNFYPSNRTLKINQKLKPNKIINKRRNLSQILIECEKLEEENLKKESSKMEKINEDKNKTLNQSLKRNSKLQKNLNQKNNLMKKNTNMNNTNKKDKSNQKISKRYAVFKKINEYLESNNIPIFELLQHNPFQKKPYQISQGYEFLKAVKFKNYQFIKEALQTSNDYLFVFDYYGQTCYHWAAKLGDIKMLRILLDYGKHHNQKDFRGRTPLYLAAVNNNKEVCDLLLRHKANIHLKDNFGNSASDVAGSKDLKYYLGDIMTQPYSNPIYKKKIADFLRKKEKDIEKAKLMKRLKEIDKEHKNEHEEEKEENDE
jgi:hypothetical protein